MKSLKLNLSGGLELGSWLLRSLASTALGLALGGLGSRALAQSLELATLGSLVIDSLGSSPNSSLDGSVSGLIAWLLSELSDALRANVDLFNK